MQTYLVGGAVRDRLLGQTAYDHDWVVVGATPQQMLAQGFQQVGKDFPVFLHPQSKEEYALARTERKAGAGYHGFEVFAEPNVSLEEDLIRRDITINAIAQSEDGRLVDPYGGQEDIKQRRIRHVSPAFAEDPLRVLRVARFVAKLAPFDFSIADETLLLMQQMVSSGELAALTPERVWQEVDKALQTHQPSLFFEVLDKVGALEPLFPELFNLKGVTQPEKYHPEGDVWVHTLMVLDAACQLTTDKAVRFAALAHDFGKGLTPPELWPSHKGHEAAGLPLVKALCQRYRLPKKIQQLAEKVTEYHGLIHQALDAQGSPKLKPKTYLKVLKACGALKDEAGFKKILLACEADAKGRLGFENSSYPQFTFWLQLLQAAQEVNNQDIIDQGFTGADIALAIDRKRLQQISHFIKGYSLT